MARVGRYGPYLQKGEPTQSLDESLAPDEVTLEKALELLATAKDGPKVLGADPDGTEVTLHNGRYGWYVQLGEPVGKTKPKRESLLTGMDPETNVIGRCNGGLSCNFLQATEGWALPIPRRFTLSTRVTF